MMILKMKASPLFQGFVHTQEGSKDLLKNGNQSSRTECPAHCFLTYCSTFVHRIPVIPHSFWKLPLWYPVRLYRTDIHPPPPCF